MTKQYTKSTVRGRKTDGDDAVSIARLVLRGEGSLVVLDKRSLAQCYVRLATKVQQQKQALGLQEQFFLGLHETLGVAMESPFTDSLEELVGLTNVLRTMAARLVDAQTCTLLQSIPGIGPQ